MAVDNPIHRSEENPNYSDPTRSIQNEFEVGLFFHLLRKSLWWVLFFFLIAISLSLLYLKYTPPMYTSSSVIQIKNSNNASRVLKMDELYDNNGISSDLEILRSKEFIKKVIGTLPFEISYFNEGEILIHESYRTAPYEVNAIVKDSSFFGQRIYVDFKGLNNAKLSYLSKGALIEKEFSLDENIVLQELDLTIRITDFERIKNVGGALSNDEYFFIVNDKEKLVGTLMNRLKFRIVNEAANSVEISFEDGSPSKAADFANAVAFQYINYDLERKIESSDRILKFIENQIQEVFERLKSSETSIQEFKIDNKLSQSEDFTSVNLDRLHVFEDQLVKLEMEESLLNEIKEATSRKDKSVDVYNLLPILSGTQFESSLSKQIAGLHDVMIQKEQETF